MSPHSRQTSLQLRNSRAPYIFLTLLWSEYTFWALAEMTLICISSVNPLSAMSSPVFFTSKKDLETAFMFLILLMLHNSVNPAKTVMQLVFFQHQLAKMTFDMPSPTNNAEEQF